MRERDGALVDFDTGALRASEVQAVLVKHAKLGATWMRVHPFIDEAELAALHALAEKNLSESIGDPNLAFRLHLPEALPPDAIDAVIDEFNALAVIEMAEPVSLPPPLPAPPDDRAAQAYLLPTPRGHGALGARLFPAGDGAGIRIADFEYSWNLDHLDLPGIEVLNGSTAVDPYPGQDNHGTAVLGQLFAQSDDIGVVGAVPGAAAYVAPVNFLSGYNPAGAISGVLSTIRPGDVIVIEQQEFGPNYTGVGQIGLLPSEWNRSVYDAIRIAVGNGRHVVEAAGNGSQNLDAPIYATGNGGHHPFVAGRDSGAIIVGAGAGGLQASTTPHSRLGFSNYGSRVNLQGMGENVVTIGYGDRYAAEGKNRWYTGIFRGTSSATPCVAGAAASVTAIVKEAAGTPPTPASLRSALLASGAAQANGDNPATQHIGPYPDVLAALPAAGLPIPANDACEAAIVLQGPSGTTVGHVIGATSSRAATCSSVSGDADVWYSMASPGATITLSTCGTHDAGFVDAGMDTVLAAFDGCGGPELACSDDHLADFCSQAQGERRDSVIRLAVKAGTIVLVRVAARTDTPQGPFTLTWSLTPLPTGACCVGAACLMTDQFQCASAAPAGASTSFLAGQACNASGASTSPCCFADFDKSGVVAVDDVFVFLNAWFAGHPSTRVGGDGMGTPTLDDLFAFLTLWFAGC